MAKQFVLLSRYIIMTEGVSDDCVGLACSMDGLMKELVLLICYMSMKEGACSPLVVDFLSVFGHYVCDSDWYISRGKPPS
eukprot:4532382-Amphidinium_carterae.2